MPNGPADKAGLRGSDRQITIDDQKVNVGGDVIIAVDGQAIKSMEDLIAYLSDHTEVGQKVTLTLLRNSEEIRVEVTLGARPTENQSASQQTNPAHAWLGIAGIAVIPQIADAMTLPSGQKGVLVQQVEAGSPADKAGFQGSYKPITIDGQQVTVGGDIITAIDGQSITTIDDLTNRLSQYKPGDQITLSILRNEKSMQMKITLAERPSGLP